MNETEVEKLFELFAGEGVAAAAYVQVINAAIQEVRQMLKSDADETDARLYYLEAALAYLRYTEITAARDRAAYTFAGTVAQNTDAEQKLAFARELVRAYRGLCCSLLADETFLFAAV